MGEVEDVEEEDEELGEEGGPRTRVSGSLGVSVVTSDVLTINTLNIRLSSYRLDLFRLATNQLLDEDPSGTSSLPKGEDGVVAWATRGVMFSGAFGSRTGVVFSTLGATGGTSVTTFTSGIMSGL